MSKRLWTVNGDFTSLKPAGVARYAMEVVRALDTLAAEGHPLTHGLDMTLVVPAEPQELALRNMGVKIVPEFRSPRMPQFWVQMQLPWHVRGGLVSLCNLAPVTIGRHIACIHDLHTFTMPESYSPGFRRAHKLILPLLGQRARFITTISEHSRSQLIQYRVARPEKIVVAYNGADHAARWDATKSNFEIGFRPFALCLGQRQKYKNIELVLKIATALDAMGLDIYITGDFDAEELPLPPEGLPRNVRFTGHLTDEGLAKALDGAVCFLFPSRSEGFGLPAVEAMARGCPVVASSAPSLPEICGEGALYAAPDDAGSWIDAVRRLCGDEYFRRKQAAKSRERAKRYTWRGVAEVYLELMHRIDTGSAAAR
jgi:glycosyltransferase involved in cell wall biosynthesis